MMRLEEAGVAVAMSVVMWVMVVQEQESRWVGGVASRVKTDSVGETGDG